MQNIRKVITKQDFRRLGGGAGILASIAAAWLLVGSAVILPAARLSLLAQENPHQYLTFAAKHQAVVWMVNVLGGLLSPLLTLVLFLALVDRFQEDAPYQSRTGLAIGMVGMAGFAIGAFLKQIGLGSLVTLYATNKSAAAVAFYAVNGTANSFLGLGDLGLGLGILVFGSLMLQARGNYGHLGFLSSITGMPLILSAFVPHIILYVITSVLTVAWLAWTGTLLWMETVPHGATRRVGAREGHLARS